MTQEIEAPAILQFHDRMLSKPDWPVEPQMPPKSGAWHWIDANHRYNTLLWHEEDKARRTNVDAGEIASCKRLIDQYNQKRNDAVEAMDEAILAALRSIRPARDARLHSETAGAMIDRLSILALKIHHMGKQARRSDTGVEHVSACAAKLDRLRLQRQDLSACFDTLLADVRAGRAYFKLYRQFKMYNDPALNPYLHGRGRRTDASGGMPA